MTARDPRPVPGDENVTVPDPDSPLGMPIYDGPVDRAWTLLGPGTYRAWVDNLPVILTVEDYIASSIARYSETA